MRFKFPDLGPPWVIFADQGKSISILPAGRTGEVVDVRELSDEKIASIVTAANQGPALELPTGSDSGDRQAYCSNCLADMDAPHAWRMCALDLAKRLMLMTDRVLDLERRSSGW